MEAKVELRLLTGGLGAEVMGYDFDGLPGDKTARLRRALVDHHLLLFRNLPLNPARQIAFTRLFGDQMHTCSPRTPSVPGFPEIASICGRIGPYWHSDGAHLQEPTSVSVHHVIVAAQDGDLLYTGLASAYERLSPEGQRQASRMWMRSPTGVAHPLVLPHPVTGRLGLYVNLDHDAAVVDEFGRENHAMRDGLERHLCAEGTYYRHEWRVGDTLVVDNFAVAHRMARANLLHRTSIRGPGA